MSELIDPNHLLRYYRRYIGDPDRTIDVYAGFGLFFGGLGLGAAGVLIFLYSATLPSDSATAYAVREVAGVAASSGLPALLLGIIVLLPVDRRMLYVAAVGSVCSYIGIGIFVWAYPHDWNVSVPPDYSAQGIAVYSIGVALVVSATGAALVAHRIERMTDGSARDDNAPNRTEKKQTESDEEIQPDIDSSLDDAEISWGGIEKNETRTLDLNTSAVDEIDRESLTDSGIETRTDDNSVTDAVSQLKGLQGGEVTTISGEDTDDQTAALRELREQQRKEEQAEDLDNGIIDRLRDLF